MLSNLDISGIVRNFEENFDVISCLEFTKSLDLYMLNRSAQS